jgi:hypothetical protein
VARVNGGEGRALGPRLATLGYHEITDNSLVTGFQRPGALPFTLTPAAFRLQMDEIARLPWAPTLVSNVSFEESGNHLLLTFDDGGKSASVPGGEISPFVLEIAAEGGVEVLFTVEPEVRPRRVGNCRVLDRYLVKRDTTSAQLGDLVRFRRWSRAMTVRRLKNAGRRALPRLYRMLVARRTAEWEPDCD